MDPGAASRTARAPGRVNLIGDHTDYNGGLALPMAVDLATEVTFTADGSGEIRATSTLSPEPARFPADIGLDPVALADLSPPWAALAAAVTAQVRPHSGGTVAVTSTVPSGAGLSSSAAFVVALAMALGLEAEPATMALLCQRAEGAVGSHVGLMDPLVSAGGRAGHALLVDFGPERPTWTAVPVPGPDEAEWVVVHSGVHRRLGATPYAARRAECDAVSIALHRPVGRAEPADLPGLLDPVLRRRARHVVTEVARVRQLADALVAGDLAAAGRLLVESHRSLAGDFEASTPEVDQLVADLCARPGVLGARMTGGGFGGCVVALARPGALDPGEWPGAAWRVAASDGAHLVDPGAAGGS